MNDLYHRVRVLLVSAALVLGIMTAPTVRAAQEPGAFVQETTDRLLRALASLSAAERQDLGRLGELVEQHVVTHVDVPRLARVLLGRHARTASSTQLAALAPRLVKLLTRAYSAALNGLADAQVEVTRVRVSAAGQKASVATTVQVEGGRPLRVKHRLSRRAAGWQLYDLEVEGVSMLTTYRRSFAAVLREGDVDALIGHLMRLEAASG